jgi:hypothetical protein
MQFVFERYLEGMEQTGTPGNSGFERRRSSAASSALHLGRRRRVSLPIASDAPLSNNKSSARAERERVQMLVRVTLPAPASAAAARLLGSAGMFGGIITAMRITPAPPTPNHSFKRTVNGLRPSPAA